MRCHMCWFVLTLLVTGSSARAAEPLVAYDNFNPRNSNPPRTYLVRGIDPVRWRPVQSGERLDSTRQLASTRLHVMQRASAGRGTYGYSFTNAPLWSPPSPPVNVTRVSARSCTGDVSSPVAEAGALLTGHFFSAATATAGSALDDVVATVQATRQSGSGDPTGTLRVRGVVQRCLDSECTTRQDLGSLELGTVLEGSGVNLRVQWDAANHRFIFQREMEQEVYVSYTVPDVQAPGRQDKAVLVSHTIPACDNPAHKPLGYVNAYFTQVMVNASAAP